MAHQRRVLQLITLTFTEDFGPHKKGDEAQYNPAMASGILKKGAAVIKDASTPTEKPVIKKQSKSKKQ